MLFLTTFLERLIFYEIKLLLAPNSDKIYDVLKNLACVTYGFSSVVFIPYRRQV